MIFSFIAQLYLLSDVCRLTFNHLMVSKVQVEQEKHVKSSQCAAQDEARSLTNGTGDEHSHLRGRHEHKEGGYTSYSDTCIILALVPFFFTMRRVESPPITSQRM